MFCNVIFPLKLKAFTYKIPINAPQDLVGRVVRAPLLNRELYGIVWEIKEIDEDIANKLGTIKEITTIHEHLGSSSIISLLRWLSDYYLNSAGVALSACFFKEAVNTFRKPFSITTKTSSIQSEQTSADFTEISDTAGLNISLLGNAIQKGEFKTFLFHSPSFFYERGFLCQIFKNIFLGLSGAIVLIPEISKIDRTASILKAIFGERVCTLHSRQTSKNRVEAIRGILSGRHDIVVGTRSAIFAPLGKVSFIAVTGEHSPSYKAEEGLRYNARDVAIMRGVLEKAPVLLSSICPSLESVYNARKGKYTFLKVSDSNTKTSHERFSLFSSKKRAAIEIINTFDVQKTGRSMPEEILSEVRKLFAKKQSFLLIASTKGYSLILCSDCGHIFRCPACNTALRFYKNDGLLRCRLCGYSRNAPDTCQVCGGIELKAFGAGVERIKEDIEKSFGKGVMTSLKSNLLNHEENQLMPFVLGHSGQARRLKENTFMSAVYCDADLTLSGASFCANERVFQNIMEISQLIKPKGRIYILTRYPKNKILAFIKNYDFKGFYKNELSLRKETDFPPFSRLILFNIFSNRGFDSLITNIEKIFSTNVEEGIQTYGHVEIPSPLRSYKYCIQYLLKSKDRKRLNSFAASLKNKLSIIKGIKINIDVDPIRF